jgi:hypothetical protein
MELVGFFVLKMKAKLNKTLCYATLMPFFMLMLYNAAKCFFCLISSSHHSPSPITNWDFLFLVGF